MKKYLGALALFTGLAMAVVPAFAVPVVTVGSTYSFYLEGSSSDNAFLGVTTFDNQTASAPRYAGGPMVYASESQTALSSTQSQITITLSQDTELFPTQDETGFIGIGTDGNGLDLTHPVSLDNVTATFRDSQGNVLFTFDNLQQYVTQTAPWSGLFLDVDSALGFNEVGGAGATSVTLDFLVSDINNNGNVPEPDSIALAAIGLLAALAASRRRRA